MLIAKVGVRIRVAPSGSGAETQVLRSDPSETQGGSLSAAGAAVLENLN